MKKASEDTKYCCYEGVIGRIGYTVTKFALFGNFDKNLKRDKMSLKRGGFRGLNKYLNPFYIAVLGRERKIVFILI